MPVPKANQKMILVPVFYPSKTAFISINCPVLSPTPYPSGYGIALPPPEPEMLEPEVEVERLRIYVFFKGRGGAYTHIS